MEFDEMDEIHSAGQHDLLFALICKYTNGDVRKAAEISAMFNKTAVSKVSG